MGFPSAHYKIQGTLKNGERFRPERFWNTMAESKIMLSYRNLNWLTWHDMWTLNWVAPNCPLCLLFHCFSCSPFTKRGKNIWILQLPAPQQTCWLPREVSVSFVAETLISSRCGNITFQKSPKCSKGKVCSKIANRLYHEGPTSTMWQLSVGVNWSNILSPKSRITFTFNRASRGIQFILKLGKRYKIEVGVKYCSECEGWGVLCEQSMFA